MRSSGTCPSTSTVVPVEWQDNKINFLDTPGYADFVGEVMAGLRVADAALVVVSAEKGVEVGTELVWQYADDYELPRLAFINKLDRENTSYDRALESLRSQFGSGVVPLTVPIGEQASFCGVVDLVSGKAYTYANDKATEGEIPAAMSEAVARYREQLVETAVESDDDLMKKYLEGEEISETELRRAIKAGVAAGTLTPVLAGAASKNIGLHQLLDALTEYAPSPAERAEPHPMGSRSPSSSRPSSIRRRGPSPSSASTAAQSSPTCTSITSRPRPTSGWASSQTMRGKLQEPATEAAAGDIGAVVRLSKTHTGDTLGAKDTEPLQAIHFPAPAYTCAVHPKTQS